MPRIVMLALVLVSALGAGPRPVLAQPMPRSAVEDGDMGQAELGQTVSEQEPRIYYFRNAEGKLVPVYDIEFERVMEFYRQQATLARQDDPPSHTISRLELNGEAFTDNARLTVTLEIVTAAPSPAEDTPSRSWVHIPLKMHSASLLDTPNYDGSGELFLQYDEQNGYQAWLRSGEARRHVITLEIAIPLTQVAETTRLRLQTPTATVSKLQLRTPYPQVSAGMNRQGVVRIETSPADERAIIVAGGFKNELVLSWRQGPGQQQRTPSYLEVEGEITVTVEALGDISSEVLLTLHGYGDPVERFELRLPPHTKLVSGDQQEFQISEPREDMGQSDGRQMHEITLRTPQDTVQVRLKTRTIPGEQAEAVNVASYEVVGALRQSGHIRLFARQDWLVDWTSGPFVRRVADPELSRETMPTQPRLLAAFDYFRQPCQLHLRVAQQASLLSVEPIHLLRVDEERLTLESRFRCTVRGARLSALDVQLQGWQFDRIEPAGLVDAGAIDPQQGTPLRLRLAQAMRGEFELRLISYQTISETSGNLNLLLPYLQSDATLAGSLVVLSADNLELTYQPEQLNGLSPDVVPADLGSELTRIAPSRSPMAFRVRSDVKEVRFRADYQVHSRQLRGELRSRIDLHPTHAAVRQEFDISVRYEPVARLALALPRSVYNLLTNTATRKEVSLQLNGSALDPTTNLRLERPLNQDEERVVVALELPSVTFDNLSLTVQYPWSLEQLARQRNANLRIPLVTVEEIQVDLNTLAVVPHGPLRLVEGESAGWQRDDEINRTELSEAVGFMSVSQPVSLQIIVSRQLHSESSEELPQPVVIERAWLQTWLTADARLDRLCCVLRTSRELLSLPLPEGVNPTAVRVLLDQVEVPPQIERGKLLIPLPQRAVGEHQLEVSLPYVRRPATGAMAMQLPVIEGAADVRRWFWHLVLPPDEHLWSSSAWLPPSHRWTWNGLFWSRRLATNQRWLENWTHATRQPDIPVGVNEYLFSSIQTPRPFQIVTLGRRTLMLLASLPVLAAGLILLYVPATRRPPVLVALAVLPLIVAWLYPSPALLVSQAAVIGVVLVLVAQLVAGLLRLLSLRRTPRMRGLSTDSQSAARLPWREVSPQATTATLATPPMSAVSSESK